MGKEALLEKLNRLAELYKIRKEAQDEINELLQDPYIYDKWYGMQNGGII